MLINIAFLLLICSGSVYFAARNQRRFEDLLPVTSIAIVLLVFVFGVCGNLVAGVITSICIAIVLYILSIIHLVRNKQIKGFLQSVFTPGSVVFLVLFFALSYFNVGKLAYQWDEFSHWVDIVKVMTTLDDFGTNALSNSAFQSYPPGMSIFQYILQKFTVWLNPANPFSEWRVYVAYQVFCFVPFMPIFKMCTFRRPLHILLTSAGVFLTPLIFFSNLYDAVYIDPFLGLVSGAGLALVLLCDKKDWLYHGTIWLYCAILVLAKDVGMLFSIFLALAYVADLLLEQDCWKNIKTVGKKIGLSLGALTGCILPKMLWSMELTLSKAPIRFSGEISFPILLDVLFGNDTTYRNTVLDNYVYSQFDNRITFGHSTLTMSYYMFFLFVVCLIVFLMHAYVKHEPKKKSSAIPVASATLGQLLLYVIGMCVIYLFKFVEYEAVNLASMSRYLNMVYLAAWIVIVMLICYAARYWYCKTAIDACILCVMLAISPAKNVVSLMDGSNTELSLSVREKYQPMATLVHKFCDGDDRIYFISQDDSGFDYWVSRFNARPNTFNPSFTWGIGETDYKDGMYAVPMTADELMHKLQEYDYVALYKLNDYFMEHYTSLFENPNDIAANCLYRIDKEAKLLRKCQ